MPIMDAPASSKTTHRRADSGRRFNMSQGTPAVVRDDAISSVSFIPARTSPSTRPCVMISANRCTPNPSSQALAVNSATPSSPAADSAPLMMAGYTGFPKSGMSIPRMPVRPCLRLLAIAFGRYLRSATACRTLARVESRMLSRESPVRTRETTERSTEARAATSASVGLRGLSVFLALRRPFGASPLTPAPKRRRVMPAIVETIAVFPFSSRADARSGHLHSRCPSVALRYARSAGNLVLRQQQ